MEGALAGAVPHMGDPAADFRRRGPCAGGRGAREPGVTAPGDHDGTTVSIEGRARRNNRLIGVGGATLAITMIGLTYGAAPFYTAFCRATGYEGTPQQVKANTDAEGHRILRVGFDANVAPGLEWSFEPEAESIKVRTGKTATVYFRVRNLSDTPTEGHATF